MTTVDPHSAEQQRSDLFRPCALVPTYDNPQTIRAVVVEARQHLPEVIVIDDGSQPPCRRACEELAAEGLAHVVHRESNGGKGAAVQTGFRAARERGFTHAFQIDADGQHCLSRIPEFLRMGRANPAALVLGYPEYTASAAVPWIRRLARRLTAFWISIEVGGRKVVRDAMVGFRVYPLASASAVPVRGRRMDFDVEIAVRMAWAKVPIINLPVEVRYLSAEEGGVSHFQHVRDNLRFCWLHSRLCTAKALRPFLTPFGVRLLGALRSETMSVRELRRVAAELDRPTTWLNQRERGTALGVRLVFWLATMVGRRLARQFARLLALYYAVMDRTVRRASREWLGRVKGVPARWIDVYRHVLRFARVSIDRVFLLQGATRHFVITRTGTEHLQQLAQTKRGAVLLGAHLGSFEAMRAGAKSKAYPIHIVGHFENARMINALLEKLDPEGAARVLHTGADPVDFALRVRERLDAGESIAILADRVGLNDKSTAVRFFGGEARFATGPFLLAAAMRCPVYLVFGLYYEPNQYRLHCEPFAETIELPRGKREAALKAVVQRFAERLEVYCRKAPDNWFNFYDFWKPCDDRDHSR